MQRIPILLALLLVSLVTPSCVTGADGERVSIENLTDEQYATLETRVATHVQFGVSVALGHEAIDADEVVAIAGILDAAADSGGSIYTALKDAGVTDHEILGGALLAEDVLLAFNVSTQLAPGPRTAALMHAIAKAVTEAVPEEPKDES